MVLLKLLMVNSMPILMKITIVLFCIVVAELYALVIYEFYLFG